MRKKIFFILFIVVLMGGSFYWGTKWGRINYEITPASEINLSLFWEVYYKLKDEFIDKSKFDPQKILYGAISGLVKSLGDPYTEFFTPEQSKIFQEDVRGYFEGVGMEIGIKKEELRVIAPLEGTPAFRAGIKAGDRILKINGKPTIDMKLEEAVSLIRGPRGTKVNLTILREGWDQPKDFEITREVIEIPSLRWEVKDDILYLKIYQFLEKGATDFKNEAVKILKIPSRKMVIDLRNNPGGYLEVAVEIAGWFLERGNIVAIEDFGNGKMEEYKSEGPGAFLSHQIVVLINEGTASGAEILAAALRENRGILLVGEKTFGKGSVQKLEKLSDGSSLKITVARWTTPKGNQISEIGLEPDIKVSEDKNEERDVQLEKAIEILRQK